MKIFFKDSLEKKGKESRNIGVLAIGNVGDKGTMTNFATDHHPETETNTKYALNVITVISIALSLRYLRA